MAKPLPIALLGLFSAIPPWNTQRQFPFLNQAAYMPYSYREGGPIYRAFRVVSGPCLGEVL